METDYRKGGECREKEKEPAVVEGEKDSNVARHNIIYLILSHGARGHELTYVSGITP